MDMTQTWHSGHAFYYPYIQIQDLNWLKAALLYWDGVRRVMPPDVLVNDPPEIREAIAAGSLIDTSPAPYRQAASETFLKKFKPFIQDQSVCKKLERIFGDSLHAQATGALEDTSEDSMIRIYSNTDESRAVPIWNVQDFGTVYAVDKIYSSQIESEALDVLSTFRFRDNPDGTTDIAHVVRARSFVAGFYRVCLANEISNRIGIPLVTDMPRIVDCSQYVSFGQGGAGANDPMGVLMKLNVDFPSPESLQNISMAKILEFQQKRSSERKRFRNAIESILSVASKLEDPNALADFFRDQGMEIQHAMANHKKSLDELNVSSLSSLLSVSAPTAIAASAGLVVPPAAIALTGMGIGLSLVHWWAEVRKKRADVRQETPWHYLLSTKQFCR
jgi:hypothetical protein